MKTHLHNLLLLGCLLLGLSARPASAAPSAPGISSQPNNTTAVLGTSPVLSTSVSGSTPLVYQWDFNGFSLLDATNKSLTLSAIQFAQAGQYRLRVANPYGTVTSAVAVVTVVDPPRIVQQPVGATVVVGSQVILGVSATGFPAPTYQWRKGGYTLTGATASQLVLSQTQLTDSATYSVVVANSVGTVTSVGAPVSVGAAPSFTAQPIASGSSVSFTPASPTSDAVATAAIGENITLSATVTGTGTLSYQWFHNGIPVAGAASASLRREPARAIHDGLYVLRVTSPYGVADSAPIRLALSGPPTVVSVSMPSLAVNPGDTVTMTAVTDALPEPTFQWLLNGFPIPGATNRALTLNQVAVTDAGRFSVRAINPLGAGESPAASLVVNAPLLGLLNDFPRTRLDFINGATNANTGNTNFTRATNGRGYGSNAGAGMEDGEPRPYPGSAKKTVWFFWQAVTNGVVTFTTDGSAIPTAMAGWAGENETNFWMVAQDSGSSGYGTSKIMFNAQAGRGYGIQLDGMGKDVTGRIVLNWDFVPTPFAIPRVLTAPQDTAVQRGQDLHLSVNLDTNNASVAIQWFWEDLQIHNATNTTLRVTNMQDDCVGQFRVRLDAAGFTYFSNPAEVQINTEGWSSLIAHESLGEASSPGLVGWNPFTGTTLGDPNAYAPLTAALRRRITAVAGYSGTQIFATRSGKDPAEPNYCGVGGGSSYWLSYTAPNAGILTLTTAGSTYDTILAVYTTNSTGIGYASLVPVACNDNASGTLTTSSLQFNTTAGVTYFIVVDGKNGSYGTAYLNYTLRIPPTISTIANLTVAEDNLTPIINFTVGDFETAAGSLVVTAHSTNTTLVPVANVTLGGSGATRTFRVRPGTNAHGTCTLTLRVTDAHGLTATRSFTLTVTPVNDAPVASTDTYYRVANGSFTVPATNILANDTDVDGDPRTLSAVAGYSFLGARVTKSSTSVTYTAKIGANGADYFTYTISDGKGGTATGRVNVYVLP